MLTNKIFNASALLVTMLHPNIHNKDDHYFPFTLNSLIFNIIHIP